MTTVLTRIQINHNSIDAPKLHNDLNKLVTQSNANFDSHQTEIDAANKIIASQNDLLTALTARVAALESLNVIKSN